MGKRECVRCKKSSSSKNFKHYFKTCADCREKLNKNRAGECEGVKCETIHKDNNAEAELKKIYRFLKKQYKITESYAEFKDALERADNNTTEEDKQNKKCKKSIFNIN